MWIVLEAIFGPEGSGEITYRISYRIAFFLTSNKSEAKLIYDNAKAGYKLRSKVVHGMRAKNTSEEKFQESLWKTEDIIRRTLKQILGEPDLIKQINGKNRETYLDSIVFSS